MMFRALAALALGGLLVTLLPAPSPALNAGSSAATSPDVIARYRQALATDMGNLTLHYLLGVALLKNDQNREALAALQTAYPAYQESIEANYNLAVAALRLEDLVSAEIYLDQAIALGAGERPGVYPLSNLYFNMALKSQEADNANEAIRYFYKVLSYAPERYEVFRQLGGLYANLNEPKLAISSFLSYLQQFPDDPVSRDYLFALEFNRAQDALAAEDLPRAEAVFAKALEYQPDNPTVLYYLGYIAYSQQSLTSASELLTKAFGLADMALQQTMRPLLYNTALALSKTGKPLQALEAIATLANQEHARFNDLFLAGTLNLELKQYRLAHDYLQRAVSLAPQHPGAHQNLIAAEIGAFDEWITAATLSLHDGDYASAGTALEQARSLQPENSKILLLENRVNHARKSEAAKHFARGKEALSTGKLDVALKQTTAGLAIAPGDPQGLALQESVRHAMVVDLDKLMNQANLALQAGRLDEASQVFNRLLAIAPGHPDALAGLNKVEAASLQRVEELFAKGQQAIDSGQTALAIDLFNQLLRLAPSHERAMSALDTAMQLQAIHLNELLGKGRLAAGRDEYPEARRWFTRALAIDDSTRAAAELAKLATRAEQKADGLASQAEQALQQGQFSQAGKLYSSALLLVPEHQPSLSGKKDLAQQIDLFISRTLQQAAKAEQGSDYTMAMQFYRSILEISPDHKVALKGLHSNRESLSAGITSLVSQAEVALNSGDLAGAEEFISAALKQDTYHQGAQQLRQRLEKMQQTGAVPGDEQKLYLQGVAYYTQGKYSDAIKAWETVLLLNPAHEKSRQNIVKTRLKLQQIKEYGGG